MRFGKWVFILMAFCLLSAVTPAAVSAGENVTQTADQTEMETVTEEQAAEQAEGEAVTEEKTKDQIQEKAAAEEKAEDQLEEEAVAESETKEDADAPAQTEETAERDARSILLHIPFVCLVMAIVLTGFILWGKNQEKKERE